MNKQMSQRRKEQQKFLDQLSMLDLEMVNGIVYDKIKQAKLDLINQFRGVIGGRVIIPFDNDTCVYAKNQLKSEQHKKLDELTKKEA